MPGTPDASAYAMPTGTSMVVMTRPATMSCRNQEGSYRRSVFNPGSQRVHPAVSLAGRSMRPRSGVVSEEGDSAMNASGNTLDKKEW